MGVKDIVPLHQIYQKLLKLEKIHNWGFSFKVDNGDYDTAIIFNEEKLGYRRPKESESWESIKFPLDMRCPDILDYEHKIIIEFEEEGGKRRSGAALATKGHGREGDIPNKRDSKRNNYYISNGFRFCRIWQSELDKVIDDEDGKLFFFLADCYCNRSTICYKI